MVSLCRIEGLWSNCHAPVPLKCLEGGQWMVTQDRIVPVNISNLIFVFVNKN